MTDLSRMGLGTMISLLSGKSIQPLAPFVGQKIDAASFSDKRLRLRFGEKSVTLRDDGQSCCEARWMSTDDDVSQMVGETLRDAEIADGPSRKEDPNDYGEHDTAFLRVVTDRQTYTFVTHNEHNGYYGGFSIVAEVSE